MTTARSSFSFTRLLPVYRNLLRQHRGSAMFYGTLGLISLPAQYLLTILQNRNNIDYKWVDWTFHGPAKAYNGFAAFFFTALMLLVPIVMAVNLFSYLHNRRSVDVYHSLPLTRAELYAASSLAGLTLIWVPLGINFLLTAGISFLLPNASAGLILLELFCWMVTTLAIFAITAFCAVQLGTDFDTTIFSLGLNGVFSAVYLMFIMMADAFIYGFSVSDSVARFAYRLSPVSLMVGRIAIGTQSNEYIAENNISMIVWLLVGLIVLIVGAWLYSRRKSEQAEAVGEMGPLQIFMRSAGTLLGGTGLGLAFAAVFELNPMYDKALTIICIAIGSMIVYFIGHVILTRNARSIPRALPVAAITTAGVCVVIGVAMFDLLGLGRWQPKVENVAEMQLRYYNSRFSDQPKLTQDYQSFYAFQDSEAVALVLAAQKEQIERHYAKEQEPDYYSNLRVVYKLNDGRTVERRYPSLYPAVVEQLIALEVDDELISKSHPAFFATPEIVQHVEVSNSLGNAVDSLTLTAEQKERLLFAFREDLLSQPLTELQNGAMAVCNLTLEFKYPRPLTEEEYGFPIDTAEYSIDREEEYYYATSRTMLTESYQNTLKLLAEFGAVNSLKNDWSQVKAAYAFPFNRSYGGTLTVTQTDLDRVLQTQSDLSDFIENYENGSNLTLNSFAFSPMERNAARGSLTSIAPTYGEPFAVVGVAAGANAEEITGYYMIPTSALPAHLKDSVAQMVQHYYGTYAYESWGYGETMTIEEIDHAATETTVAVITK